MTGYPDYNKNHQHYLTFLNGSTSPTLVSPKLSHMATHLSFKLFITKIPRSSKRFNPEMNQHSKSDLNFDD